VAAVADGAAAAIAFLIPASFVYNRLRDNLRRNVLTLRQKGSFAQNFAITFSGTALVAVLGLVLTPVMSRIYSPAAYGLFAVFNSIVNNVNLLSTLAYPPAFLLPRLRKRFLALVHLTLLLTLGAFLVTGVGVLLLHDELLRWLNAEQLGNWFYLVPVTVFIFNVNMIMGAWYLRSKDFKKRAGVEVSTSLAGRGLTIGYGLLTQGAPGGLIIGDIFGRVTGFFTLLFSGIHRQLDELWRAFSWRRIKAVAYEYREYPFYVMPTGYLNVLAAQLPIFFLTSGFGAATVGLYSFSTTLLELPINLIGNAVAPVFMQKAAETHETDPERLKQLCLDLFNKLLYLGLLPFGIITVFGDWIFSIAFGPRWEMAGVFTGYLGFYYVFKLTSYAISPIYAIFRRQRTALLGTVLLVAVRAASLSIGLYLHQLNLAMLLFGVSSLVVTFGVDLNILRLLKLPVWRVAFRSIALVAVTLAVLYAIRLGLEHYMPVLSGWWLSVRSIFG
jgi:O-antigen/teichoic acid export membrane protein